MECAKCGMCCWSYVPHGDSPWDRVPESDIDKCEYLAPDLRTCTVYDRLEEVGRPECIPSMRPTLHFLLHPDCSYLQDWLARGTVVLDDKGYVTEVIDGC